MGLVSPQVLAISLMYVRVHVTVCTYFELSADIDIYHIVICTSQYEPINFMFPRFPNSSKYVNLDSPKIVFSNLKLTLFQIPQKNF